jgi:hypothetical protein
MIWNRLIQERFFVGSLFLKTHSAPVAFLASRQG